MVSQLLLLQDFVEGLEVNLLKKICVDLLRRSPGAYSDYVSMGTLGRDGTDIDAAYERYIQQRGGSAEVNDDDDNDGDDNDDDDNDDDDDDGPPPDQPLEALPWCRCHRCRNMPTQEERKCCRPRRGQHCISTTGEFARLCLDHMVLHVAMRAQEDLLAEPEVRNNAAYRHQAYRVFIYWQHGRLGHGNRRVIPSCVVWAIRDMWPEPTGIYKGFIPGIGHLGD